MKFFCGPPKQIFELELKNMCDIFLHVTRYPPLAKIFSLLPIRKSVKRYLVLLTSLAVFLTVTYDCDPFCKRTYEACTERYYNGKKLYLQSAENGVNTARRLGAIVGVSRKMLKAEANITNMS